MRTRITRCLRAQPDVTLTGAQTLRSDVGSAGTSDYDLNRWPRDVRNLTPAAVLVPLIERSDGFTVLLTERTQHLNDHAGQISFPGGRLESQDRGPVDAALRETEEEVGIAPEFVEVAGYLDSYETVTGYLVAPVVGFVRKGFRLRPDHFEVADVFEVPLDFLLDPLNHQMHSRHVRGEDRRFYVFEYGARYIWGATAGMLMNLCRRLRDELPPEAEDDA
ncbi:MAG: CoA pyrophosphatase [Gammaproteobacteria bacterium]|nr:CoA pyrophosphatase [Gammaproteobacteria bacterium]NIR82684.1 CoA pyrophosphatase [Gammaproteobacteria bacterium]NIR89391.1 CoA pyrophosphatase [Gammaproteobacteria bacterium]NIU03832.1 CoA pyrophosphatase [Gammaproteobacteria bacterium]NIV51166.1 CoA pyrophosphatase [Gammaproteobacteria bacterium]